MKCVKESSDPIGRYADPIGRYGGGPVGGGGPLVGLVAWGEGDDAWGAGASVRAGQGKEQTVWRTSPSRGLYSAMRSQEALARPYLRTVTVGVHPQPVTGTTVTAGTTATTGTAVVHGTIAGAT